MEREEVKILFRKIENFYGLRASTEEMVMKVDEWHSVLCKYDFSEVHRNFLEHVEQSEFAPRVSDLIKKEPVRTIPTAEETQRKLAQRKRAELTEEQIQEQLERLARIVGYGERNG